MLAVAFEPLDNTGSRGILNSISTPVVGLGRCCCPQPQYPCCSQCCCPRPGCLCICNCNYAAAEFPAASCQLPARPRGKPGHVGGSRNTTPTDFTSELQKPPKHPCSTRRLTAHEQQSHDAVALAGSAMACCYQHDTSSRMGQGG